MPTQAEQYLEQGVQLSASGRFEEALSAYRAAIALQPDFFAAHVELVVLLRNLGRTQEAVGACQTITARWPDNAEAHNNLGVLLAQAGQHDQAIAAYVRSLELRPAYAEALNNLGLSFVAVGDPDRAGWAFQRAIQIRPDYANACNNLGTLLKDHGRADLALRCYERAIACDPANHGYQSNRLYALHFQARLEGQAIAQAHRQWNQTHAASLRAGARVTHRPAGGRLRIGYVSPDFRRHPIGRFILPLFQHHDRSQFEVCAYSHVIAPDEMTRTLQSHADLWREIGPLSDDQAADLIRNDCVDILVDLTMHMAQNRLLMFARKPAPVQVTYLAYASTTGLDAMDFRLSDPYLDPPDRGESLYAERTIRLPETYWCYQPPDVPLPISDLPARRNGYVTYGCLNQFSKVNPRCVSAWVEILRKAPTARLILHAREGSHRQLVLEPMRQGGVEASRVEFVAGLSFEDYFRMYQRIDLALDPFPHGGGTTTCDALWMGVPVVSLVGQLAVERYALSLLSNVGLPEWTARSEADYIRLAVDAGSDLANLIALRAGLRGRLQKSPIMDGPRFARNIEAAFRQMWALRAGSA